MRFVYGHDESGRLRFAALQTPQGKAIVVFGLMVAKPTL